MGPEELAIITNPGFVRGCLNAGNAFDDFVFAKVAEAKQKRDYIAANDLLANVNLRLVAEKKRATEDLTRRLQEATDRAEFNSAIYKGANAACNLANQCSAALEAAGLTTMYVITEALRAWAASGQPDQLDHLMLSHAHRDGRPLTMREYLWFANVLQEMLERGVDRDRIDQHCPVDNVEDFLSRPARIDPDRVAETRKVAPGGVFIGD